MPEIWTREVVDVVKKHYVAVAVNGRTTDLQKLFNSNNPQLGLSGAGGNLYCLTPAGKPLLAQSEYDWAMNPLRALEAWQRLPAAERRPGAIQVKHDAARFIPFSRFVEATPTGKNKYVVDGNISPILNELNKPLEPPPGGLIVKVNYRMMTWENGKARHAKPQDFERPDHYEVRRRHHYEAHPDFMWLTEPEWRSLIPTRAKEGETVDVPTAVQERILRFHIHPYNLYEGFLALKKDHMRGGELKLNVESVSATQIRLRLEGQAETGLTYEKTQQQLADGQDALGYEPRLLGYIEYDRNQDEITRFDMVAFGEMYGGFVKSYDAEQLRRSGRQPMGVAFELADPTVPANLVWPMAACHPVCYFCGY